MRGNSSCLDMPDDSEQRGDVADHSYGSDQQRIGALEQDMAAVKAGLTAANAEISLWRERYHDTIAPALQRLVIQSDDFSKSIGEIKTSIASITGVFSHNAEKLDSHLSECAEISKRSDANRHSFRKEMRGYFVTLLVFALGLYLSQRFHLSIVSGTG
jgi:hypothetical protein